MKKKLKIEVRNYNKAQDIFANTKHEERKALRLMWKSVDLDKDSKDLPNGNLQRIKESRYWANLASPFQLGEDTQKPSANANDLNYPFPDCFKED